ncbi:MAG: hypothetical protein WCI03_12605 [bacterium]|jgi:hypothetical protein
MNQTPSDKSYSAFFPVVLIALGIIILLSWNLMVVLNQYSSGVRISAQQDVEMNQVAQAEGKLKAMMNDLLALAKTDAAAAAIVNRYKIAIK